jgi:hypothetical protein
VEVVVLGCDWGLVILLPLLVNKVQALGETAPPVLRRLTQVGQLPELLGPFRSAATLGEPSADPTQAVLLDDHQARFLAEEDLIGGGLFNAWAAEFVQDGQQGGAAPSGLLGHAAELGHAGRLTVLGWLVGGGLVQKYG